MKKLNLIDMDAEGLIYVAFSRVTASRSHNGIGYFRYRLEKPLSKREQAILNAHYNNIAFGEAALRYSPQTNYQSLLVFDKKIK